MALQVVQKADRCEPSEPAPQQQDQEPCQGTLEGSISGTLRMDCCCPRLITRTFIIQLPPQQVSNLLQVLQNTVGAYENNGYMVLAHSLTDTGGGWMLGLTIGYYA